MKIIKQSKFQRVFILLSHHNSSAILAIQDNIKLSRTESTEYTESSRGDSACGEDSSAPLTAAYQDLSLIHI